MFGVIAGIRVLPGKLGLLPFGRLGLLPGTRGVIPGRLGLFAGARGVIPGRLGLLPGARGVLTGRLGLFPGAGGGLLPGTFGLAGFVCAERTESAAMQVATMPKHFIRFI